MRFESRGASPFERYRDRLEGATARCEACGHVADEPGWRVVTDGRTVEYRRRCGSCGAAAVRDVTLR